MVYCGKPSKGCANCRKRRIRCDTGQPACGQCIKAKKECPGYRDMLDLSFRNESDSVVEKVNAKYRQKSEKLEQTRAAEETRNLGEIIRNKNNNASSNPSSDAPAFKQPQAISWDTSRLTGADYLLTERYGSVANIPPMSTFSMYPTMEDRGVAYFAANFVTPQDRATHGSFTSLYEIKQISGGLDDSLLAALSANGIADFANTTKSVDVMRQARNQYAVALRLVNKALGSPVDALKDSTLLVVLLLAMFETVAGSKQPSLKEWTHHMNGAAALLKLRGRAQFRNSVGITIFMHASTQVIVGCLHREVAMPAEILALRQEAFDLVGDEQVWEYLKTADKFTVFRGAVRAGTLTEPKEIITAALEIDREMLQIFTDIPHGWVYETVVSEVEQDKVFDRKYDIYYDHCMAQTWNGMRTARIMLNETICFQLGRISKSRTGYQSQWDQSTRICIEMSESILCSVPQLLGYVSRLPFQGDGSTSHITEPLTQQPSYPSLGSWFLLWPLFIAGTTRAATPEIRDFAAKILDYMGGTVGIKQGTNLASFIRATSEQMRQEEDDHEVESVRDNDRRVTGGYGDGRPPLNGMETLTMDIYPAKS